MNTKHRLTRRLTRRSAPRTLVGTVALLFALLLAGCGVGKATPTPQSGGLGNDAVAGASVITAGSSFQTPLDAAYDPNGKMVYFIATGSKGPSVFSVSGSGGEPKELASGGPLVRPQGLVVGSDGQTLYLADAEAASGGAILKLAVAGGVPIVVAGTSGTAPRNLDLVPAGDRDLLYFSGTDPNAHQPAILSIPANGDGAANIVYAGAPLLEPDGVAVTADFAVFVADRSGKVFKLTDEVPIATVIERVKLGTPAGVALTVGEKVLLVSAIDEQSGGDRVVLLDVATNKTGIVDKVVGENKNSSGGVHRARKANIFAWADRSGGKGGRGQVYSVTTAGDEEAAAVIGPQRPKIIAPFLSGGRLCLTAAGSRIKAGARLRVADLNYVDSYALTLNAQGTRWCSGTMSLGQPPSPITYYITTGKKVSMVVDNPDGLSSAIVEFTCCPNQ